MAGINYQAMAPGMSRLALAIGGGGQRRGYDDGLMLESKLAQALAQVRESDAKTMETQQGIEARSPEALRRTAMMSHGVPLDEGDSVDSFLRTGRLGGKYDTQGLPGPVMPTPAWADKLGEVARSIGLTSRALAIGDKNSENIARAGSIERGDRLSDAIIRGTQNRNTVAGAQAAAKGDALFSTDSTGSVLDRFTGNLATDNPLAGSTINLRQQQAGQARAAATENYAQAGAARALEQQRRDDIGRAQRSGDIKEVIGPDGAVYLVNKVTGLTRQVVGADGRPLISGKGSGAGTGAGKPMTEGQAKANLFGGRMTESDQILREMEDAGTYRPGAIKAFAEGVAGAIPLVGDSLREGASAATNWTQSDKQQRIDQARRDFVNAVLRRESGAVISAEEFANADKQYFPQMGDSKEVIEQKRRNRELATRLMLQEVPEHHRYQRKPAQQKPPQGPVAPEGSWGDQPAAGGGWRIERVN